MKRLPNSSLNISKKKTGVINPAISEISFSEMKLKKLLEKKQALELIRQFNQQMPYFYLLVNLHSWLVLARWLLLLNQFLKFAECKLKELSANRTSQE